MNLNVRVWDFVRVRGHRAPILAVAALLCVGRAQGDLHWWLLQLNSPSGPAKRHQKVDPKQERIPIQARSTCNRVCNVWTCWRVVVTNYKRPRKTSPLLRPLKIWITIRLQLRLRLRPGIKWGLEDSTHQFQCHQGKIFLRVAQPWALQYLNQLTGSTTYVGKLTC